MLDPVTSGEVMRRQAQPLPSWGGWGPYSKSRVRKREHWTVRKIKLRGTAMTGVGKRLQAKDRANANSPRWVRLRSLRNKKWQVGLHPGK